MTKGYQTLAGIGSAKGKESLGRGLRLWFETAKGSIRGNVSIASSRSRVKRVGVDVEIELLVMHNVVACGCFSNEGGFVREYGQRMLS
jgi:hypothetical protein